MSRKEDRVIVAVQKEIKNTLDKRKKDEINE